LESKLHFLKDAGIIENEEKAVSMFDELFITKVRDEGVAKGKIGRP